MAKPVEVQLFKDLEIRDIAVHISDVAAWHEPDVVTLWFSNTHDQDLTVQIKGNRLPSRLGAVNLGASFTLSAGSQLHRTLTPTTTDWLPFILITVVAAIAPNKGKLNVTTILKPGSQGRNNKS